MISVEMEDVLAVLQLCKPYIIGIIKGKFRLIGALGKGLINGLIAINKDMNYGKELSSH